MQLPYSDLRIRHWNPGAAKPLILPIQLLCNTDDDALEANIRANAALPNEWLRIEPAHDRAAILCGSGPSIEEFLPEIADMQRAGGDVFALNGAAAYLAGYGIMPDYQVILDARAATADLVGPANVHLLASQVHPECFRRAPHAILWHLQIEGIDDLLASRGAGYCLIGGAASVGNTATCVAFAMGYRTLHCYGYDSSHRQGRSHAMRQAMNDGEPVAEVDFAGHRYTCSLTMKLQAEKFMLTSAALKDMGATIQVHGDGLLPAMYRAPADVLAEAEKYERLWQTEAYREMSPGEQLVDVFRQIVQPDDMVLDLGCGTGRAGLRLVELGIPVTLLDFTPNSRDQEAWHLPFVQADLTEGPLPVSAPYGLCADVMEHLPPDDVDAAIDNIMEAAERVFFAISTVPDKLGALVGQQLHLTVQPHDWWRAQIAMAGHTILWEHRGEDASMFHVKRKEIA